MASDDESFQSTVTELLREVSAARNDLLKADEVRRIAADEFRKMVEARGRPLVEVVEKLDKALKDQDQPRGPRPDAYRAADHRLASPTQNGEFLVAGSLVSIVTQMPDFVPGRRAVSGERRLALALAAQFGWRPGRTVRAHGAAIALRPHVGEPRPGRRMPRRVDHLFS